MCASHHIGVDCRIQTLSLGISHTHIVENGGQKRFLSASHLVTKRCDGGERRVGDTDRGRVKNSDVQTETRLQSPHQQPFRTYARMREFESGLKSPGAIYLQRTLSPLNLLASDQRVYERSRSLFVFTKSN